MRIIKKRIRSVHITSHPLLFEKMEQIRKAYQNKGIRLSQVEVTNLIAKKIKPPKIPNILKNVK